MEFSRQEYWSGLPFPSPGDLPDIGIAPGSPVLQADSLLSEKSLILASPNLHGPVGAPLIVAAFPRHSLFHAPKCLGEALTFSNL